MNRRNFLKASFGAAAVLTGGRARETVAASPPAPQRPRRLRFAAIGLNHGHINGQVDAAPATPDEPPLTFPESRCPASPVRKADWTVLWKAWPAVSRSTPTRSSAQCSSSPVVHHLG